MPFDHDGSYGVTTFASAFAKSSLYLRACSRRLSFHAVR